MMTCFGEMKYRNRKKYLHNGSECCSFVCCVQDNACLKPQQHCHSLSQLSEIRVDMVCNMRLIMALIGGVFTPLPTSVFGPSTW